MGTLTSLPKDRQSLGEEIANSISHGLGLLAAMIVTPIMIVATIRSGNMRLVVGTGVFAAAIILMYLSSTLYHALPEGRAKRVFRVLDHGSIYLLIAGTYTPFTLGVLGGGWGWTLFGTIWGLAVFGIVTKSVGRAWHPVLSTVLYLVMGWLAVIAVKPFWESLPREALAWLAAGGVSYTAGVGFYAARRMKFAHFVWHLFVAGGTACHIVALLSCAR